MQGDQTRALHELMAARLAPVAVSWLMAASLIFAMFSAFALFTSTLLLTVNYEAYAVSSSGAVSRLAPLPDGLGSTTAKLNASKLDKRP